MIFEEVEIGTGAAVAARAVVTRNVPPYAVVAGVPARIIKYRHPEALIQALLASRWWQRPIEELRALPLNHPEKFLLALKAAGSTIDYEYACAEISRAGAKIIGTPQWKD